VNLTLRFGNLVCFFIGCLGFTITHQGVHADSDFLLFMDLQNIIILVPSLSLMISAILFLMYDYISSNIRFSLAMLLTMSVAGTSLYALFKDVYSYIGLSILGFELFLIVTMYFYICLFFRYFINKIGKTQKKS
jgi:hypothetical protein